MFKYPSVKFTSLSYLSFNASIQFWHWHFLTFSLLTFRCQVILKKLTITYLVKKKQTNKLIFSSVFLSLFLWPGSVPYLIIGFTVMIIILMALLKIMMKMKKQESKTHTPPCILHTCGNISKASTRHDNKCYSICLHKCQVLTGHRKKQGG